MKYQQLENLECGWKWNYLVKKWKEGESITCHIDSSEAEVAIQALLKLEHQPTGVLKWISENMSPELDNKLKQAIRAIRLLLHYSFSFLRFLEITLALFQLH